VASAAARVSHDTGIDANDKRIRVDARKWLLSKALPKIYGDRLDLNATIAQTHEQSLDVLDRIVQIKKDGTLDADESADIGRQIKTLSNNSKPQG